MRKLQLLLTALLLVSVPSLALADAAGSAKGVKPAADAALAGETRTLVVGSDVFIGDLVQTGPRGQVQILFADNTELVVGPSSALTIEDYLIRNDGSAGKLAVDMLSGAFRFATGDSAKNRYEINTPTGTIGVRGTGFDVVVKGAVSRILLFHGAVRFCTDDGKCKELRNFCELGEIASTDTAIIGDTRELSGEDRRQLRGEFIYAENQSPLLREFWMNRARECVINVPEAPADTDTDSGDFNSGPDKPDPDYQTPPPPRQTF